MGVTLKYTSLSKRASMKRQHIVGVQLRDILEKAKLEEAETADGRDLGKERGLHGRTRDCLGQWHCSTGYWAVGT